MHTTRFARWLRLTLAAIFLIGFSMAPVQAEEAIENFVSDIILLSDGSVDVTERITVTAEGSKIRRGIYRDIPTFMTQENGPPIRPNLEILSVGKNGQPEPWFTETITNGKRLYIGDADVFLSRGTYTYTIRYTMTRIARRFETYDELFWNVTGNFWDFPIRRASATFTMPQGAVIQDATGYTGAFGSEEQAVALQKPNNRTLKAETTRPLRSYEGLSVAVSFQKGILAEPQGLEKALIFLADYKTLILPAIALAIVFLYYFLAWDAVGRDPRKGTIFPRFHPPASVSPGLIHYIAHMGWKKNGWQAFSAALVDLAVKGLITIDNDDKKKTKFTVIENPEDPEQTLPPGEAVIFNYLNAHGTVTINKSTGPTLNSRRSEFISKLETENRNAFFKNNTRYTVFGVVLSLAALIALVITDALGVEWVIVSVFAGVFLGIIIGAMRAIWNAGGIFRFFQFGILGIFAVNFIAGGGAFLGSLFDGSIANYWSVLPAMAAISIIAINLTFAILMRAPTVQGRKLMDEIEGFKMYLETAEKERLNFVDEPQLTTKRFEKILPYAMALGVEKPWTEHFEAELGRNAIADARSGYHPGWYHASSFSSSNFSRDMAGLASGMSAAMIAAQPASSSSSGSSGGGFSGGGGGGGGGGGW